MTMLYHFTDTARLPWILKSGELRSGANRVGGFPDPDFLWATSDAAGDRTASAYRGEAYRSGKVWHVRFGVKSNDFVPWHSVPSQFPAWTAAEVKRLEDAARGRSSPATWWCRASNLPLSECLSIEARSYTNKQWSPVSPDIEIIEQLDQAGRWLSIRIGQREFTSLQSVGTGPGRADQYRLGQRLGT